MRDAEVIGADFKRANTLLSEERGWEVRGAYPGPDRGYFVLVRVEPEVREVAGSYDGPGASEASDSYIGEPHDCEAQTKLHSIKQTLVSYLRHRSSLSFLIEVVGDETLSEEEEQSLRDEMGPLPWDRGEE